jgi:isopenicillin-N N-acyltransferase-like protein
MHHTPPDFPLIDISGTPAERGAQHGEGARDRIALSVGHYTEQIGQMGLTAGRIEEVCEGFLPSLHRFAPDLVDEMRGIARGAGVGLAQIVLLNARTEVLQIAERESGARDEDPDGCTGAVILPEATRDGRLIHGQNWDWKAECADTSVVLRIRREGGPNILTFTEAGGLARSGLNAAGIAITANYLECDRDYRTLGIPLPLIRRRALEARHYATAIKIVATTPKSGSNNMLLSHAGGEAVNLECAPDECFPLFPEDGTFVHANHWLAPAALAKLRETGLANVPDSLYRDRRVRRHLAPRIGQLTRDDLKAALFDDFGSPHAVCRPPRAGSRGNLSATVAMIVMEPALGLMEIAPLPALNRRFAEYRLQMDDAAAVTAAA